MPTPIFSMAVSTRLPGHADVKKPAEAGISMGGLRPAE
jgi:hypothetical protein